MAFWNRTRKQKSAEPQPRADSVGFAAYVVSDVGCLRDNNEDNYILCGCMNRKSADHSEMGITAQKVTAWQFVGVFDGMGGGDKGELASQNTAEIFLTALEPLKNGGSRTEVDVAIRGAFLDSNNRIVDLQKQYQVFGTTGTVLSTDGSVLRIYHLGDSRAYLFRDGQLYQLTRDQTMAQMKIDVGIYDENHPQAQAEKHKLTEFIGRDWTRENLRPVESEWLAMERGDRVLLCSDGLYDMCSNEEIAGILRRSGSAERAAKQLVQAALRNGGEDNVTCAMVELR